MITDDNSDDDDGEDEREDGVKMRDNLTSNNMISCSFNHILFIVIPTCSSSYQKNIFLKKKIMYFYGGIKIIIWSNQNLLRLFLQLKVVFIC